MNPVAYKSFLDGGDWPYIGAMVAIVAGMALVFFFYPRKEREEELRASYHARDEAAAATAPATGTDGLAAIPGG